VEVGAFLNGKIGTKKRKKKEYRSRQGFVRPGATKGGRVFSVTRGPLPSEEKKERKKNPL